MVAEIVGDAVGLVGPREEPAGRAAVVAAGRWAPVRLSPEPRDELLAGDPGGWAARAAGDVCQRQPAQPDRRRGLPRGRQVRQ